MKYRKTIGVMILAIAILASIAALTGILSNDGSGSYSYETIRGQSVKIYGYGLYKHMTWDVAVQGIAQDYVTLFVGIPLIIIAFIWSVKNSLRGMFLLSGTLGYFLVSYLFYLCMAMYNELFLVYTALASLSFYAFMLSIISLGSKNFREVFSLKTPHRVTGGFLIFNSIAIGLMWLSILVPRLIDGTIYPADLNHYTTLIVQGLDLSILLPASFIAGLLFIRKNTFGYLLAPIYFVFLSILMTALTAKIIGMSLIGVNPGPAIIIIPVFNSISIICTILIIKSVIEQKLDNDKNNS